MNILWYALESLSATGTHLKSSLHLTESKYSTARLGLLKAALIARSISARGNPILSMLVIAADRSDPNANADGSLKLALSGEAMLVFAGAGDGVAGTFADGVLGAATGAGGGAGVWADAGTGVDGAFDEDGVADELAGALLGYLPCQLLCQKQL